MASEAEIAELWRLFRENRDQIAALNAYLERSAEADERRRAEEEQRRAEANERRRAEEERRRAEEERRRAEAERRRTEEDQRRAEEDQRRAEDFARWRALEDERSAKREAAIAALDKQIAETNKQIGNLTGKWGLFVEEMVRPAAETIFLERGIQVHEVHPRMLARREGESMEIDVFVSNDDEGVAIEVKTTLGTGDVRKFLNTLARFKRFFPRFADIRLYGAVAGIDIPDHVRDFAINQGLFVLGQSGETVAIRNDRSFKARAW